MRLPSKEKGQECTADAMGKVEVAYLDAVKRAVQPFKTSVMSGEGRVLEVETFDVERLNELFTTVLLKLPGWQVSEMQRSLTDGLGRIFCQFSTKVKKYVLSGYLALQFHEVPYYKDDSRIPETKRQLELLAEKGAPLFEKMNSAGNSAILTELKRRNIADLDFETLFAKMFQDERFLSDLEGIGLSVEQSFEELHRIEGERDRLISQLDTLVTYVYQTSPVLIDNNRLIGGEEGAVIYFDLNIASGKEGEAPKASFDATKIPPAVLENVCKDLRVVAGSFEAFRMGK